jgi:hypothetical protein
MPRLDVVAVTKLEQQMSRLNAVLSRWEIVELDCIPSVLLTVSWQRRTNHGEFRLGYLPETYSMCRWLRLVCSIEWGPSRRS